MVETGSARSSATTALLWRLVLVFLLIGTVVGVLAVVRGNLDKTQAKILITCFGVSFYAATALGCSITSQRRRSFGARLGLFASVAGVAFLLAGVWFHAYENPTWWKAFGSSVVVAFACAHASMLSLVRLHRRHATIARLTRLAIYGVCSFLVFMMLTERANDFLWRCVGVLSVCSVFGTLAVPVLARLAPTDDEK